MKWDGVDRRPHVQGGWYVEKLLKRERRTVSLVTAGAHQLSCSLVCAQCLAQGSIPIGVQPVLLEQICGMWKEEGAQDGTGVVKELGSRNKDFLGQPSSNRRDYLVKKRAPHPWGQPNICWGCHTRKKVEMHKRPGFKCFFICKMSFQAPPHFCGTLAPPVWPAHLTFQGYCAQGVVGQLPQRGLLLRGLSEMESRGGGWSGRRR